MVLKKRDKYICAFFLPIYVLLFVMLLCGIWPMGDKSLMVWDMEIQYLNIYNWLHDVLHGEANLFYDFSKSLGGNMYSVFGGYLISPINLLIYFFKPDKILFFIAFSTLLKIGLSGLFCQIYLSKRFSSINVPMQIAFSLAYALMEYNVGLCSNLHFMDVIYMLPIVALGTYLFVNEGKKNLFIISLAYSLICSWYVAYMVCVFIALYFFFEVYISGKYKNIKNVLMITLNFGIHAVIGVLISGFTFIPSIMATLNGKGEISKELFIPEFHCSFFEPLKALLITSEANNNYEEPAIYVGGLVIAIILLCFCDKKINLKKKIAFAIPTFIILLSFSFIPLEVFWTGMKKTYSFHFRYAFVFSFWLIFMAAYYLNEVADLEQKLNIDILIYIAVVFAVCFFSILISKKADENTYLKYISLVALYIVMYYLYGLLHDKREKNIILFLIIMILSAELGQNAKYTFKKYKIPISDYNTYVKEVGNELDDILSSDDTFFRLEKTFSEMDGRRGMGSPVASEGLTFNYNAITHYSTYYDGNVNDLLMHLGYIKDGAMASNYVTTNPVMDSIFGVKYLLTASEYPLLKKVDGFSTNILENVNVLENEYALSFATPIVKYSKEIEWGENPFENQSKILGKITGKKNKIWINQKYEELAEGKWSIKVGADGPVYAYFACRQATKNVLVNEVCIQPYFDRFHQNIMCLGNYKKGDLITLEIMDDDGCVADHNLYVCRLDVDEYENVFNELKEKTVSPDIFKDSYVMLNYEAQNDECLMLSVPYDAGWRAYINGKKVKTKKLYSGLMAIDVKSGENKIEIKYTPPYLKHGILCTFIGMMYFVVLLFKYKLKKSRIEN